MGETERKEEEFDAQLAELMKPDAPGGKKKKRVHKNGAGNGRSSPRQ